MIPAIVGFVTRREGHKFLYLKLPGDADFLNISIGPMALYVHIPFCRKLCPFCCFNRYLFKEDMARRYFTDLKRELDIYLGRGFAFNSVYFGGGTPTVLMDELGAFVDYLKTRCDIKKISLETTPDELTIWNIELLKKIGVDRLSVGVQSFEEPVLKTMGRYNGPSEEVKRRLLAAEGQFATLNVDFVFNFPGQTLAQFESDVAAFKALGIDQATFYPLMASPHKKDAMERRFNRVDNSREKRFYDLIIRELYHGGYQPSTAWCFSRGERMIDEYIIEDNDYVGIGAGSVSMIRDNFLVNSFSLERYHAFAEENKLPLVGWRHLSAPEARRYYLLTKLFGLKVDLETLNRRFDGKGAAKLGLELTFLKRAGIVSGKNLLNITEHGMYPVSVMMREFFASLNTLREQYIERQI